MNIFGRIISSSIFEFFGFHRNLFSSQTELLENSSFSESPRKIVEIMNSNQSLTLYICVTKVIASWQLDFSRWVSTLTKLYRLKRFYKAWSFLKKNICWKNRSIIFARFPLDNNHIDNEFTELKVSSETLSKRPLFSIFLTITKPQNVELNNAIHRSKPHEFIIHSRIFCSKQGIEEFFWIFKRFNRHIKFYGVLKRRLLERTFHANVVWSFQTWKPKCESNLSLGVVGTASKMTAWLT